MEGRKIPNAIAFEGGSSGWQNICRQATRKTILLVCSGKFIPIPFQLLKLDLIQENETNDWIESGLQYISLQPLINKA